MLYDYIGVMRKKYWILGGAFVFFVLGFGIFAFDWIKN